jgi:hypothetical protein
VSPDTPVFVLHLYDRALVNRAGLRILGYTRETPDPPGGHIERDRHGNPTGLLIAKPNALILYSSLAKGPKLGFDDQINSTRHFLRELNRLGITSTIDAGGGFQSYPDDYRVIEHLAERDDLTLRLYTEGSAWFSGDDGAKGRIPPGPCEPERCSREIRQVMQQPVASAHPYGAR